ncbi:CRISPR-associated protein Csm4 [Ectothiorhodospira magna]|uniref:CRISPR system Cms protein Csm4 n=1 Tax=Ectothiorhodospira magna TaxID=867345 RepID=A0A1H9GCE6_9GAMM|nr:CRISPR-associated protein Csm7 [Ectothiorhodospira magna]SEQ47756.1 CRISPR-associated protein Csm4 [Ectothiorhodospira magna]
MEMLRIVIEPRSAFGGPIRGDTLFGQLCWAARNRWGELRLQALLEGYTDGDGRPFAVCSDAFPSGFLPRPALPLYRYAPVGDADRKALKKRRWIPIDALSQPMEKWLALSVDDTAVATQASATSLAVNRPQPHNSINRCSGTTGPGAFAPYTQVQHWYSPGIRLDVYLVLNTQCLTADEAILLLRDIGLTGYGRDASIGLGKFEVLTVEAASFTAPSQPNACFTLAPCAPQGLGIPTDRAFYEVFTRFGRHGGQAVFAPGGPFKTPVLLAAAGGVFGPDTMPVHTVIGQGLGGQGRISKALPDTVQQGYAPYAAVRVNWEAS